MSRYVVYTWDGWFLGYVLAQNERKAQEQGKRKWDLIFTPQVYLDYLGR